MSPKDTFEQIVAGQFGPAEWYELELDAYFPQLDPNTAVGMIALARFQGREDAIYELARYRDYLSEPDTVVYEEEISSAMDNWGETVREKHTFIQMYNRTEDIIRYGATQDFDLKQEDPRKLGETEPAKIYQYAVDNAHGVVQTIIRGMGITLRQRQEAFDSLACLVDLYRIEEGSHFVELLGSNLKT